MQTIKTLQQAEAVLHTYKANVQKLLGGNLSLERMAPLLACVGNPEKYVRVVHVAGTSGKTSTSYYMAALLWQAGLRVGLSVSPHVYSLAERVQINGTPVSEADFCAALQDFLNLVEGVLPTPTYYELLTAFALWYFAAAGVDFAVMETGIGGLYDCTNVCRRPDKLCIITDIGFDHTAILGTTLAAIATQKAGIIHAKNKVVVYRQGSDVDGVIISRCQSVGAEYVAVEPNEAPDFGAAFHELPPFQRRNWFLAYNAYAQLVKDGQVDALTPELTAKTWHTYVPARQEILTVGGKKLILDGAHNLQKMTSLNASIAEKFPGIKPAYLLSARGRKDFFQMLELLAPTASQIIVTKFKQEQALDTTALRLSEIRSYCEEHGLGNVVTIPQHDEALRQLLASEAPLRVITGSFYLISRLHGRIMELQ